MALKPCIRKDSTLSLSRASLSVKFNSKISYYPGLRVKRECHETNWEWERDPRDKYWTLRNLGKAPENPTPAQALKIAIANANALRNLVLPIYGIRPSSRKTANDHRPTSTKTAEESEDKPIEDTKAAACPAGDEVRPREWLADTGCGYDLIGKTSLGKYYKKKIFKGKEVTLYTANGPVSNCSTESQFSHWSRY